MKKDLSDCTVAHGLRDQISIAIDDAKWKTVGRKTEELCELLPKLFHLDGMLKVGWQTYFEAPAKTKESLERLNAIIGDQRIIWAKNKKKSEKKNKQRKRK